MRRQFAIAIAGAFLALSAPGWAGTDWRYALDPSSSDVRAKVGFLGLASKTARFPQVAGTIRLDPQQPEAIALDVTLDARALRAGDPLTLQRLKGPQFFNVERHPTVRFLGHAMTLTGSRTARIAGELTARGITRPEVLNVTFGRAPDAADRAAVGLVGTMQIDRRTYGMTAWNGIVGNKVTITIRTRMVPQG